MAADFASVSTVASLQIVITLADGSQVVGSGFTHKVQGQYPVRIVKEGPFLSHTDVIHLEFDGVSAPFELGRTSDRTYTGMLFYIYMRACPVTKCVFLYTLVKCVSLRVVRKLTRALQLRGSRASTADPATTALVGDGTVHAGATGHFEIIAWPVNQTSSIKMAQHLDSTCVLLSDPSTFGAGGPNQNTSRIQHEEV